MLDFKKSVDNKIKQKTSSKNIETTRSLWNNIFNWYEEGGESKIKAEINSMLNDFKNKFNEEHKKIEKEIESV